MLAQSYGAGVTDEQRPYGSASQRPVAEAGAHPALPARQGAGHQDHRADELRLPVGGDLRRGRHRLPARRRLGRQHRVRLRHDDPGHGRRADPAHARRRAAPCKRALVVADMPFGSYENGPDEALHTAIRFMKETGCPRRQARGRRAQRQADPAHRARRHPGDGAHRLHPAERARPRRPRHPGPRRGRRSSCSPTPTRSRTPARSPSCSRWSRRRPPRRSPRSSTIPTICVGAGPHCDGQLLVWTDWAGFTTRPHPQVRQAVRPHRRHAARCRQGVPRGRRIRRLPGARARILRVTDGGPDRRSRAVTAARRRPRQIDEAVRDVGFFQIVGHGIDPDVGGRCVGRAHEFFALPLERSWRCRSRQATPTDTGRSRSSGSRPASARRRRPI